MKHRDVDRMVNLWLDWLFDISSEAGFRGQSILSRMIDFRGDLPRGSGYYPADVVMIAAAEQQKPKPPGFDVINGTVVHLLKTKPVPMKAVLTKLGYCGLNPITDATYTNEDRAFILGITPQEYKNALQRGYDAFIKSHQVFESYESAKII